MARWLTRIEEPPSDPPSWHGAQEGSRPELRPPTRRKRRQRRSLDRWLLRRRGDHLETGSDLALLRVRERCLPVRAAAHQKRSISALGFASRPMPCGFLFHAYGASR